MDYYLYFQSDFQKKLNAYLVAGTEFNENSCHSREGGNLSLEGRKTSIILPRLSLGDL